MNNEDLYKVMSFQAGQTKNGKDMWRIGLRKEGTENVITGVIWSEDIPRFDGTKFKVGNIIKFLGQDYSSNYNSVVVKNVTVLKEALAGLDGHVAAACLLDLNNILTYTLEKNEKGTPLNLLAREIKGHINSPIFQTTPAAEKFHHNYIGGLLKHTHEVVDTISHLGLMFPIEKSEELVLAAMLHDIGKCFEYNTDLKLGTATTDKEFIHNQISHIVWGMQVAQSCGAYDVARMVASHHGRVEWGALFEPETPEEKILHLADMLSATTGITTIDKLEVLVESMQITKPECTEDQVEKEETTDACENDSNVL